MRVQRAPLAAQQPQPPPSEGQPGSAAPEAARPFSADLDLDVTRLVRLERSVLLAEIVVRLVLVCRRERLIDDHSALRLVRLSNHGLLGHQLGPAVGQSAYAISTAFDSLAVELPRAPHRALSVLDAGLTSARTVSDWGLGGVGVVTIGPVVSAVASRTAADGSGLSLTQRQVARLGFVAPDAHTQAGSVLRALHAVARSIEELGR